MRSFLVCLFFFVKLPCSGTVNERKLMGLHLTIVSPFGSESQCISFENSKRVVKETEEEIWYCGTPYSEVESDKCFTFVMVHMEYNRD